MPDFGSGDYVRYIAQSNFIVQYEILERHAYEFGEVSEAGETGEEDENENTIEGEEVL